jgi:hypothetical protein
MFHPASLLLSWMAYALFLQWVPLPYLLALAALALILASAFAPLRSRNLLWRSRWLLFSLAVFFLFFTPGEFLPGVAGYMGVSYDGLAQAGEHLGRLLALLAGLAILHERIGTDGILTGLYWLLRPFRWRETTVVRLILVLEYVEQRGRIGWREWLASGDGVATDQDGRTCISLAMPELQAKDKWLIGGMLAAGMGFVVLA